MDPAYKAAKKKVKKKKKFINEVITFVGVSIGLMALNLVGNSHRLWFLWAVGPWGLTLLVRGAKLYMSDRTDDWEREEIRKQLIRLGRNPDDYEDDDYLELKDQFDQKEVLRRGAYKDSDLV